MTGPIKKGDLALTNRQLWLAMEDAENQQVGPASPVIPGWGVVHGFKAKRRGEVRFIASSEVVAKITVG